VAGDKSSGEGGQEHVDQQLEEVSEEVEDGLRVWRGVEWWWRGYCQESRRGRDDLRGSCFSVHPGNRILGGLRSADAYTWE